MNGGIRGTLGVLDLEPDPLLKYDGETIDDRRWLSPSTLAALVPKGIPGCSTTPLLLLGGA
jgi:hypothetical protein